MIRLSVSIAAVAVLALAFPARSEVLYSTGFEPPTFSPGALSGQGGWSVYSYDGEAGKVTVETTLAYSGAQAVELNDIVGQTGPYYAVTPFSPSELIEVSAEVYVTSGKWQFGILGPGLSLYAGGVDFTAGGAISAISENGPDLGTISADAWHDIAVTLNYASQTYSVSLDGTVLASGLAFCGANAGCNGEHVSQFGDVLFDAFSSSGSGYIDDVTISALPEPGTWGLMLAGAGLTGGAMRRRARRAVA